MNISQTTMLSKPSGNLAIPKAAFAYLRTRLKHRIHTLIIREFKKSGLTQADLARRLGKDAPQLSRLLSSPGNMTVDTISDLLFAIDGKELSVGVDDLIKRKTLSQMIDAKNQTIIAVNSPTVTQPQMAGVLSAVSMKSSSVNLPHYEVV